MVATLMITLDKTYPRESLRIKLERHGVPPAQHHLSALKEILLSSFQSALLSSHEDPDEVAEILIYLTQKKLICLKQS